MKRVSTLYDLRPNYITLILEMEWTCRYCKLEALTRHVLVCRVTLYK